MVIHGGVYHLHTRIYGHFSHDKRPENFVNRILGVRVLL